MCRLQLSADSFPLLALKSDTGPCILTSIHISICGCVQKPHGVPTEHQAVRGIGGNGPSEVIETLKGKEQRRQPGLFPAPEKTFAGY